MCCLVTKELLDRGLLLVTSCPGACTHCLCEADGMPFLSPDASVQVAGLQGLEYFTKRRDRASGTKLAFSPAEKVTDGLFHHRAADLGNRPRQGDVFGTNFHAILRVTAFLDAAIAHQRRQPFTLERRTRG